MSTSTCVPTRISRVTALPRARFISASARTSGSRACSGSTSARHRFPPRRPAWLSSGGTTRIRRGDSTGSARRLREWWQQDVAFFDTTHSRAWIMVRRIAHTAHHRAEQTTAVRLLGRQVWSVYGPCRGYRRPAGQRCAHDLRVSERPGAHHRGIARRGNDGLARPGIAAQHRARGTVVAGSSVLSLTQFIAAFSGALFAGAALYAAWSSIPRAELLDEDRRNGMGSQLQARRRHAGVACDCELPGGRRGVVARRRPPMARGRRADRVGRSVHAHRGQADERPASRSHTRPGVSGDSVAAGEGGASSTPCAAD